MAILQDAIHIPAKVSNLYKLRHRKQATKLESMSNETNKADNFFVSFFFCSLVD